MTPILLFLIFSSLWSLVFGSTYLNDWTKPCFSRECYHHSSAGSIKVWGSPTAISDITNTAGWSILTCSGSALVQDIRLVCHNSACTHLHEDNTDTRVAIGKLVRLPEDCGASSFARVANIWVDRNQKIPASVIDKITTNTGIAGRLPSVYGLAIDTNFAAVNHSRTGPVSIAIQGSNFLSFNAEIVSNFQIASGSPVLASFTGFDKHTNTTLAPFSLDKLFPLLNLSVSCPATSDSPAFTAYLKADSETKLINTKLSLGLAATGTIIPLVLSYIGVFAGLDAELDVSLALKAHVLATVTLPTISLFKVGIPGLDFPGILTLGPSIQISAQAQATLDIGVDLELVLKYNISGVQLFFPPSNSGNSGGNFANAGNPFTLSVVPSNVSSGTASAHIIPNLILGLDAFSGAAKASIHLDFDASIILH
ncbi:hypothetical protein C8J56DRAFT_474617 [Mycena floridula]|nr:hypothetical protein C8J56DRAFT_474617 [Mycena floridula]